MRLLIIPLFLFGSLSSAQVIRTDHFLNFWIDGKYQNCNDQNVRYEASRHARSPSFTAAGKISAIAAATNQNVDHPCYQICGTACFRELEAIFGSDRRLTSILSKCLSNSRPQVATCSDQASGFRARFSDFEEKLRTSCSLSSRGFTSSETTMTRCQRNDSSGAILFCSDRALSVEVCSASIDCKKTSYFESGSYSLRCFAPDETYAGNAKNLVLSRGGTWPTSCSNMRLEHCAVYWSDPGEGKPRTLGMRSNSTIEQAKSLIPFIGKPIEDLKIGPGVR